MAKKQAYIFLLSFFCLGEKCKEKELHKGYCSRILLNNGKLVF